MELTKIDHTDGLLDYDSFKNKLDDLSKSQDMIDELADKVSAIPSAIKLLTRFDPTGLTGDIISLLEENKANREKEAINTALYALYAGIQNNTLQIAKIKNDKLNILTEQFFEEARKVETEKIEYIRNAYFYGLENNNTNISEDKQIISIISSLTINEIKILVYSVKKLEQLSHKEQREGYEKEKRVTLEEIKTQFNLSEERAIQSCMSLIGRGLFEDWGVGRMDYSGPKNYIINDFSKLIIDYAVRKNA